MLRRQRRPSRLNFSKTFDMLCKIAQPRASNLYTEAPKHLLTNRTSPFLCDREQMAMSESFSASALPAERRLEAQNKVQS